VNLCHINRSGPVF